MAKPLIAYPTAHGAGKYHAATPIVGTAACDGRILLDTDASPIHVTPGQTRVHPIVCRRCLRAAR